MRLRDVVSQSVDMIDLHQEMLMAGTDDVTWSDIDPSDHVPGYRDTWRSVKVARAAAAEAEAPID